MAEQKISMNLSMVSVPAGPLAEHVAAPPRRRYWTFNAGRFVRQLLVFLAVGLLSLAAYWAISRFFVQSVEVVGNSMIPTLQQNGYYLLNRWAYRHNEPHRGDVVVIVDPGDHGISVKRIVALPGESVHFLKGRVYINGEKLAEPYLIPHTYTFTYALAQEQLITCGRDQYFVLGDNRQESIDSRAYGPVSREGIMGQVVLKK